MVPSEPTPYHTVAITDIRPRSQSEKRAVSGTRKKKPPIAPRRRGLKMVEEEDSRDRVGSVGTRHMWNKEEEEKKNLAAKDVARAGAGAQRATEADYLKVVL